MQLAKGWMNLANFDFNGILNHWGTGSNCSFLENYAVGLHSVCAKYAQNVEKIYQKTWPPISQHIFGPMPRGGWIWQISISSCGVDTHWSSDHCGQNYRTPCTLTRTLICTVAPGKKSQKHKMPSTTKEKPRMSKNSPYSILDPRNTHHGHSLTQRTGAERQNNQTIALNPDTDTSLKTPVIFLNH
jgi:hypothetical protein